MIIANLTMITANLALAKSINYDRKVCCKPKRTFMFVNYDPKPFIVQATGLSFLIITCKYVSNLIDDINCQ
jgi:hypothetical protein